MATYRTRALNFAFFGDGVDTQVVANISNDLESTTSPIPEATLLQVTSVVAGVVTTLSASYTNGILSVTLPTAPGTYASGSYVLITAVFSY